MSSKRIPWIDIAKAIGILTIVVGHTSFLIGSNFLPPLLNPWKVPIFPFLGGYLYKPDSIASLFTKKAKGLFIPYLIAAAGGLAVWSFITRYPPYDGFKWNIASETVHILTGTLMVSNSPLWFAPAYFIALVMMHLAYPVLKKASVTYRLIFAALIFLLFPLINPGRLMLPYSIDLSVLFFGFFILGNAVRDPGMQFLFKRSYFLVALFIFVAAGEWNRSVDIYQRLFSHYPLFVISAVTGVYLVSCFAKALAKLDILSTNLAAIGRRSFLLMASHVPIIQLTTLALYSSGALKQFRLVFNLASFWFEGNNAAYIRLWATFFLIFYVAVVLFTVKLMVYVFHGAKSTFR